MLAKILKSVRPACWVCFTTLGQAPSLTLLCILLPAAGESKKDSENHTPSLQLCSPSTLLSEQPGSPAAQLFLFAVSNLVCRHPHSHPSCSRAQLPALASCCFLLRAVRLPSFLLGRHVSSPLRGLKAVLFV